MGCLSSLARDSVVRGGRGQQTVAPGGPTCRPEGVRGSGLGLEKSPCVFLSNPEPLIPNPYREDFGLVKQAVVSIQAFRCRECRFHVTRRNLMRMHPVSRAMLGCGVAVLLSACLGIAQQPDAKQSPLPEGLRHVPADAMG